MEHVHDMVVRGASTREEEAASDVGEGRRDEAAREEGEGVEEVVLVAGLPQLEEARVLHPRHQPVRTVRARAHRRRALGTEHANVTPPFLHSPFDLVFIIFPRCHFFII